MTAVSTPEPRPSSSAAGVAWRLDDLYSGPDDARIGEHQQAAETAARDFAARYRGRVAALSAAELAEAATDLERVTAVAERPLIFAHLLFAADTSAAENGALLQAARERFNAASEQLIFFSLEWRALAEPDAQAHLEHPQLARHRHWLENSRKEAPYSLSEPEERVLDTKELTGRQAFMRLFDEQVAALRVSLEMPGENAREASLAEGLAGLYDAKRERRIASARAVTAALRPNLRTFAFILNTLVRDLADNDRLRGRGHMMLARNLANEIEQPQVDALLEACDGGMELVVRYYRLKKRLLGVDRLTDTDRYAPVFPDLPRIAFPQARELVLEAYHGFAPEMADIAARFFDQGWIDAELRPGKTGGGFSAGTLPDLHPYILINYTDNMRDVMTLAHELGHGVHQYLSRPNGVFQMHTPLTTAETASVFGEMLVFHKLMAGQDDPKVRLGLLCGQLEGIFATVFRQAAMTRFEQAVHTRRRERGELDIDAIGELWMEANRPMFGDVLELTPDYRMWWAYIGHFIHSPFYCYAYSFGELLVLALYRRYEREGAAFVPRYLELLAAGGSLSPPALLSRLGLDIADPGFWAQGLALIEQMVTQAETLAEGMAEGMAETQAS